MKCSVAIILLIFVTVALSLHTDLSSHWENYKKKYNKNYTQEEDAIRRAIWENNVVTIFVHNLGFDVGMHTYIMGISEYTDMSHEEFLAVMTGLNRNDDTVPDGTFDPPSDLEVPSEVDWRKVGYVTEIENQGECGGSWAFSAAGALEGLHKQKTGNLVPLSEQNLIDCVVPSGDNSEGCNIKGSVDEAFNYVKSNGGINTKQCYPSEQVRGSCNYNGSCVGTTCAGYEKIESGNEDYLKKAVATVGPISVEIDVSSSKFQLYRCGIFEDPSCSSNELNHASLVVGYGDKRGHDYWLLKNSWGINWGCYGYFKISRNKNNHCGVATKATYPVA